MGYRNLAECVRDLEEHGQLIRVDTPLDPNLEIAYVQRRALLKGSPAILFTRPKGCSFPMLANLFGSLERVRFIFRDALPRLKALFQLKVNPREVIASPLEYLKALPGLWHLRPKRVENGPVLAKSCAKADLPKLVSWPGDGGAFVTLPIVLSQNPDNKNDINLGMYRVQLTGNDYLENEAGMHYQLMRGIGVHHARALELGQDLAVNIHVGGPPCLTMAAIMPLPEGISELYFAGVLGGRRLELAWANGLPVLAQCDFLIAGSIGSDLKPEGPFGDHLGYYSLTHDFPALKITAIHHRPDAIWPFTSVGRPPQEDSIFGEFIHELTGPLVETTFAGISELHAVDAAGVHPLLLAIGSERYAAYEAKRRPLELLTQAMHLLGATQTSLAKFILIAAREDNPGLSCKDIPAFFGHILERTDFSRDLHFFTESACDTLDYSGHGLHQGSRLIWAAAGEQKRRLATEIHDLPDLPPGFNNAKMAGAGILVINGPKHVNSRGRQDVVIREQLCQSLHNWPQAEQFPLLAVVDDADFCAASFDNFLWTVFTRTDPCLDSYGAYQGFRGKHWFCRPPFILDARKKPFHAPVLEDDPDVVRRVENLAAKGGSLAGII